MLLFHCILTLMYDLFQKENQVFKPTSLLVLLHCRVGKDWAGPIFPPPKCSYLILSPPSKIFGSFNLLFSLSFYVTLYLYLNNFEWPIPKRDQVFNQQVNWYFYIVGWGKLGGPILSPSKMLGSFYLSSRLLDYSILLLYLNSLDLYQAENQLFKPTSLFVIVGWGKTGPAHSFPPH